jgi:hypothetical protein
MKMAYDPPVTHSQSGYAVFQVVRGSDLHYNAAALGLVVQRAEREYPEEPVIVVFVDGEVRLDDGQ